MKMAFAGPSLRKLCVLKIVKEIKQFCPGVSFEDLGKYIYIVGPFEYLRKSLPHLPPPLSQYVQIYQMYMSMPRGSICYFISGLSNKTIGSDHKNNIHCVHNHH